MAPGQPHLFARRIERHGEPRQNAIVGPKRSVLQEEPRLRIDEGGGRPVRHRDALRNPRRAGREDDPRVVVGRRRIDVPGRPRARVRILPVEQPARDGAVRVDELPARADDAAHARFAEHEVCALLGIIGVDGHIGRSSRHHAEDRDVEVSVARGHAHADAVAAAHAERVQASGGPVHEREQLCVAQRTAFVLQRRRVGMRLGRGPNDVDEGASRRRGVGSIESVRILIGRISGLDRRHHHGGGCPRVSFDGEVCTAVARSF